MPDRRQQGCSGTNLSQLSSLHGTAMGRGSGFREREGGGDIDKRASCHLWPLFGLRFFSPAWRHLFSHRSLQSSPHIWGPRISLLRQKPLAWFLTTELLGSEFYCIVLRAPSCRVTWECNYSFHTVPVVKLSVLQKIRALGIRAVKRFTQPVTFRLV